MTEATQPRWQHAVARAGGWFLPILLVQLGILLLAATPLGTVGHLAFRVAYYGSLLLGIHAARVPGALFRSALAAAVVCFLADALGLDRIHPWVFRGYLVVELALLVVTAAAVFSFVLRSRIITFEVIVAAITVYFLAGLLFAFLYIQIDKTWPGAFAFAQATPAEHLGRLSNFLYFSFTALTTVGFGDITPVRPLARALAVAEAFFGQIYLAVLVARLVGIQITQAGAREN